MLCGRHQALGVTRGLEQYVRGKRCFYSLYLNFTYNLLLLKQTKILDSLCARHYAKALKFRRHGFCPLRTYEHWNTGNIYRRSQYVEHELMNLQTGGTGVDWSRRRQREVTLDPPGCVVLDPLTPLPIVSFPVSIKHDNPTMPPMTSKILHYDFSQGPCHHPSAIVCVSPSTSAMERPVTTLGWGGRGIQMWGERKQDEWDICEGKRWRGVSDGGRGSIFSCKGKKERTSKKAEWDCVWASVRTPLHHWSHFSSHTPESLGEPGLGQGAGWHLIGTPSLSQITQSMKIVSDSYWPMHR